MITIIILITIIKVDVEEQELGGFLKTATGLQIKGLSDDQSGQVMMVIMMVMMMIMMMMMMMVVVIIFIRMIR